MGRYLLGWVLTLAFVALGVLSHQAGPPPHPGAPPDGPAVTAPLTHAGAPTPGTVTARR